MDKEVVTKSFITHVPVNAVSLTITAKIIDENDEFHTAVMKLKLPDIIDGFIDGYMWEDENATYEIIDEGEKYLESLDG